MLIHQNVHGRFRSQADDAVLVQGLLDDQRLQMHLVGHGGTARLSNDIEGARSGQRPTEANLQATTGRVKTPCADPRPLDAGDRLTGADIECQLVHLPLCDLQVDRMEDLHQPGTEVSQRKVPRVEADLFTGGLSLQWPPSERDGLTRRKHRFYLRVVVLPADAQGDCLRGLRRDVGVGDDQVHAIGQCHGQIQLEPPLLVLSRRGQGRQEHSFDLIHTVLLHVDDMPAILSLQIHVGVGIGR